MVLWIKGSEIAAPPSKDFTLPALTNPIHYFIVTSPYMDSAVHNYSLQMPVNITLGV